VWKSTDSFLSPLHSSSALRGTSWYVPFYSTVAWYASLFFVAWYAGVTARGASRSFLYVVRVTLFYSRVVRVSFIFVAWYAGYTARGASRSFLRAVRVILFNSRAVRVYLLLFIFLSSRGTRIIRHTVRVVLSTDA
jgi:hypothetical protein